MQPKIRVMSYTLVITDTPYEESFERGLPYEKFLLGKKNSSAALELKNLGVTFNQQASIARIEPVHIHAARDHLVLTSPRILDLEAADSEELFAAVKDIFSEMSSAIYRPRAQRWFMEANSLASLSTVSTQQAEGRNIDHWMPQDTDTPGIARQWRKWQNEIQMIWFDHPVNQRRQSQELLPINSIWISGIGSLADMEPHPLIQESEVMHSPTDCLAGISQHLGKKHVHNITTEDLNNTLSLLSAKDDSAKDAWSNACQLLLEEKISEFLLIDFPDGIERQRLIKTSDFPKTGFLFFKKPTIPTLQEILVA